MNWQLPILIGQAADGLSDLRKRVEETTLPGTTVPETALKREGTSNPFATEYWFPESASEFAPAVDFLYMGIFWISLVFFVAIVATMIYFCIKYRRHGTEINPQPSPSHNTAIEILWSVLPSILLVWMFYEGAVGYFDSRIPRDDAEEIHVMASRYNWVFTYPDGDASAELHIVRDRPTKLIMQSKDVLHSLYVPAFRQKMDIVPGRYTYCYIMANEEGQYRLSCTEYCGEGHSKMRTMCEVHKTDKDRKENTQWIEAEHAPWENGERIYKIHCSGCHKIDGTAATGPALNTLWAKGTEKLHGGGTVKVDRQYIQDSLWEPAKDVVDGFGPVSKMNSFKGLLQEEDVNAVVDYLKYLNDPSSVSQVPAGEEPVSTDGDETGESESEESESDAASEEADSDETKSSSDSDSESEENVDEDDSEQETEADSDSESSDTESSGSESDDDSETKMDLDGPAEE